VRVRRLGPDDDPLPAITLLQMFFREEGFATPPDRIAENLRRMLALDICAVLLAEQGEEAIGVATVSMEFGIEYGWSAEMGDLYVLPSRRGTGTARALVRAAEEWLRSRGASGYQVTVTPDGETAHGLRTFYHALGFGEEGRSILFRNLV